MQYLDALNWRYATKRMNGEKVPAEKIRNIVEAVRLAPTSYGLQPFNLLVIEDEGLRKKLAPAIYNQPQVTEGSALLVFAAWKTITPLDVEAYIQNIAQTRNIPAESLADFKNMMLGTINSRSNEQLHQWAARQAYIGLGFATMAAAMEQVDSTPMEGFNPEQVNDILGLDEQNLHAVSILALGYRDESNDYLAKAPKVRRPAEEFVINYETELA
ncbi:NAD(P)H-dependent oxidoreductase [Flavihumibacter rivuli]|uniref:NAD(P)H-dependent oxidoreductase n=1 Tax=Flavihumibacter rivuli TaxID=2838156 RepID=UPI001BDE86AA|nr:NAD(P)H-dependent oxidoreductase [Flavihumibacter rivuli]ULQ55136.1 NAD(P)H-dependent oxidoreductase [Flavihumibacter rivuli]